MRQGPGLNLVVAASIGDGGTLGDNFEQELTEMFPQDRETALRELTVELLHLQAIVAGSRIAEEIQEFLSGSG